MAADEIPPWVEFVLAQVSKQFDGVNARLDSLVTRDAFTEEQKRVNEKFDSHGREISSLRADLAAEATARAAERLESANKAAADAQANQRTARQTNWQWLALIASPFIGGFALWILNGGLAATP
jgi:septal ring factor EnvC (AmiA/AmiB activator)